MPLSTFVDKREIQRRRTATTPYEDELILLPEFDTFIFHTPDNDGSGGDFRWTSVLQEDQAPADSSHLVVGLMNPWNDNDDYVPPVPPSPGTPRAVRTPTRSILAYGMTGLPANSSLVFAKLNLTTRASQNWIGQSDSNVENPQGDSVTPDISGSLPKPTASSPSIAGDDLREPLLEYSVSTSAVSPPPPIIITGGGVNGNDDTGSGDSGLLTPDIGLL